MRHSRRQKWAFRRRIENAMILPCKPLITAGLVVGLLAAAWGWHAWDKGQAERAAYAAGKTAGAGEVRGEWQASVIIEQTAAVEASEQRRADDAERARKSQEAINAANRQARRDRAAATAARSELDRMLAELAALDAIDARDRGTAEDPTATGGSDAAPAERGVLGACGAEYQAMAADAAEVAGRLRGLQEWVRGVCVSP